MFPSVLNPPPPPAYFECVYCLLAVAEGWLLLDIAWLSCSYRYIFLQGHSAFFIPICLHILTAVTILASLYSQSKSDFWRNLNFRYKGKLELSVLVAMAMAETNCDWLVAFSWLINCASKTEREVRKFFSGKYEILIRRHAAVQRVICTKTQYSLM